MSSTDSALRTAESHIEAASTGDKLYQSRQWSPVEALLLAVLALVAGVLVGRETLTPHSAVLALVRRTTARGAGFVAMRRPLGGTGRPGGFPRWGSQPTPQRPKPKAYYLPAEMGVHHYTILGACRATLSRQLPCACELPKRRATCGT
jgi:hypothetical protein